MGLIKCPRCELNYMLDTDKMCSVCRREVRGEGEQYEMIELCSECGENPVVPGQELCAYCLKEHADGGSAAPNDETIVADPTNIGDIDSVSVSTMDEIELDIGEGMDDEGFDDEEDGFFDDEDADGEDEDDGEF